MSWTLRKAVIKACTATVVIADVTHVGSTLRLILDWAWERVIYTKEQLDKLCEWYTGSVFL